MENVKQTKNYEQFKLCSWNRAVKESNLKKLDKSVRENGWLIHPILVNEKMEVVDGQHRLLYAREHDLPVYYTMVEGLDTQDCVVMNNSRSAWTILDYIAYYAEKGNDNYIILKSMVNTYSFLPVSVITAVAKGAVSAGNSSSTIKTGKFEISSTEYKTAIAKLDFLEKCSPYILRNPGRASGLFFAVAFAYDCPGVDRNVLLKRIQNDMGIITPPANTEMAVKGIEELYNYRLARKNYVYIYTEYKKYALARIQGKAGKKNND